MRLMRTFAPEGSERTTKATIWASLTVSLDREAPRHAVNPASIRSIRASKLERRILNLTSVPHPGLRPSMISRFL